MAKKKTPAGKAKVKAEKKARTAQKVDKKEKKKAGKSKQLVADEEDDDNQDLEGILDQVSFSPSFFSSFGAEGSSGLIALLVDEKRMGRGA